MDQAELDRMKGGVASSPAVLDSKEGKWTQEILKALATLSEDQQHCTSTVMDFADRAVGMVPPSETAEKVVQDTEHGGAQGEIEQAISKLVHHVRELKAQVHRLPEIL